MDSLTSSTQCTSSTTYTAGLLSDPTLQNQIVGDIRNEEQVFAAVEQAVERFGGIDICVNNASAINIVGTEQLEMKPQIAVLDRAVAGTGYLAGDSFTLADINILPMLFYVNRFEEGKAMLGAA